LLVTPAAAHSTAQTKDALQAKLRQHVRSLERNRQVLRFFDKHRWLLSDSRFAKEAARQVTMYRAHLVMAMRRLAAARAAIEKRQQTRKLQVMRAQAPRAVICRVFGRYCSQALAVARCESNLSTNAENGQYLGLFQMGSSERRLFGHGADLHAQVRAAHRYFVRSGRDWSPWPNCGRLAR
jgi:hypothetical protein